MAAAARILFEGESAEQIAELVSKELQAAGHACDAAACLSSLDASTFVGASAGRFLVFVLECDREGDASAARSLVRKLKKTFPPDAASVALAGASVAVLALARSVCAFSAASAGKEKYQGGARLLTDMQALGARQLCPTGGAEIEVEDVDVHVLPWARTVCAALGAAGDLRHEAAPPPPSAGDAPTASALGVVEASADALPSILSHLPAEERAGVASVSQAWRDGSTSSLLELQRLDLRSRPEVTDGEVLAMLARAPNVRELNVAGCRSLTDGMLAALPGQCPRLRSLNVACVPRLSAAAASAALGGLPSLAEFECAGCFAGIGADELASRFGAFLELDDDEDGLGKCQG